MHKTLQALINNQPKILRLYALGALLFFIGIGFIQSADKLMDPSIEQEGYALLGLIVGGSGFVIALTAQVFLIIYRFQKMGNRD
ncbi:MAG: hypothetical protein GY712_13570 [Oceanicoccus sp.]|uniref:hypothetical protein n=1 Tax=Oceanicoccus sp. TaxID=2691044 RepID=UPI002617FDA4|nr:hypothetical protein [Oceanicoccus sp.]MCP3909034.1 hypothetical protein [Oceanicoccus sp.]MDG1772515.1 hypothetical protein [Oceanicoccus sp.]